MAPRQVIVKELTTNKPANQVFDFFSIVKNMEIGGAINQKIIEVRIGTLTEEVEVTTNVKLNPLYIADPKDEIESLRWTTRIIRWILDRAIDGLQQLGVNRIQTKLEDTKKFENMLHDKIEELKIELEDSNTDREKEVVVNQINTLKYILDHLFYLKYGEKARAIDLAEANNDFRRAVRLRKQMNKSQDLESKISAKIQN